MSESNLTDPYEIDMHNDETARRATDRVRFQLTYARASQPRCVTPGWMDADAIDDAWEEGQSSSGEWDGASTHPAYGDRGQVVAVSEEEWLTHYASMAVNEAVHEALEWFQVDGRPWLNPHGPSEDVIYELVGEMCAKLAAARAIDESL